MPAPAFIFLKTRNVKLAGICWLLVGAAAMADDVSPELAQPAICSATTAAETSLGETCSVAPLEGGGNAIKLKLKAKTSSIEVGNYKVTTENYNDNYLTPVVEAMPGDTVKAHFINLLKPRDGGADAHDHANSNTTNYHYFHGGIVSPNNARPMPAELGTGDNVFVHLNAGMDENGADNNFHFEVPIPGEGQLDARVLEREGYIPHPLGLNWYHSHLHGISSGQVAGGMSGLLSVGEATANVRAASGVEADTATLKERTDVRYALLRDIVLRNIGAPPKGANGSAAKWNPHDFPRGDKCNVWKDGVEKTEAHLRKGFCQPDENSAWLFPINGQRFPTIKVKGGRNLLLRLPTI